MMPNPKKVNNLGNQDYASIYEDNFVKKNDPVQLGQQAFTRQLSQGVQNKLNPGAQMDPGGTVPGECPPGQILNPTTMRCEVPAQVTTPSAGSTNKNFFDRAGEFIGNAYNDVKQGATNFVQGARDYIINDYNNVKQGFENTVEGVKQGVTNTYNDVKQGVTDFAKGAQEFITNTYNDVKQGAVGDFVQGAGQFVENALQDGYKMIEKPVGKVVGAVGDFVQDQIEMIEKPVGKVVDAVKDSPFVQEVVEDLKIAGKIVGEDIQKVASTVTTFLEGNVQQPIAKAVTDAVFAAAGGEEKVVKKVVEEVTPFLQENVDPYFTGEKTVFDDMGIEVPGWLTNKNPTLVADDYENAFSEAEGPSLPEATGPEDTGDGGTKKPNDIRTGDGETKGGELTLEDADTGDYSQVVVNNDTGESSTGELEEVSKGVTSEVQTRMTELTTQLTQQISEAEQFYAREYDRILNQIAMRGRQSQVGGFTGGIQEQIAQFASAAEIQQLNALAVERNSTIQGLQAQFANIPLQAQQYANELLSSQLQNENIRTQALSTLYTDVLNGVRTIEEAQAFADQYGLGNVQELMDRVNKVQTEQTMLLNPNMDAEGNIVPHTIDSLRTLFPNATDEELQAMLAQQDALDITSLAQESQMIAEELNEALNIYDDEVLFEGGDTETNFAISGAVSGAAVSGALIAIGAAVSGTGVGLPLGAVMIVGGLIVGGLMGAGQGVGQDDVNEILGDFGKTSLFQGEGNIQSLFSGEATVSIADPNVTADEAKSGYGQYNDKFTVNLNGTNHKMEGYQIVTLAISLKNKGMLDDYPEIKQKAQQIHDSMPGLDFSRFLGGITGNIINNVFKLYKQNFK